MYTITEINIYPVKSLRGMTVDNWPIDTFGLYLDRRWMLIDEQNRFLTQRQEARMALVDVTLSNEGLQLDVTGMDSCQVPLQPQTSERVEVRVWNDQVSAQLVDPAIDEWFSRFLKRRCRLVFMPGDTTRLIDQDFKISQHDQVGFADGFPFLLISEASLNDLNERLMQKGETAVPMHRFRPNLVISGCSPYEEDGWNTVHIGGTRFHVVKPCSRCIIPTINRDTAEKGNEPVRTLMEYRKRYNKIYFGQNLVHDCQPGSRITTGDKLTIIKQI